METLTILGIIYLVIGSIVAIVELLRMFKNGIDTSPEAILIVVPWIYTACCLLWPVMILVLELTIFKD